MDIKEQKAIIEAMLFASGRAIKIEEFMAALELPRKETELILQQMRLAYEEKDRGLQIIKVDNTYQMCTKPAYYDIIYSLLDTRKKPNLTNANLEVLSIIAYNPRITRAEIDSIRGVSSDGVIYKLLDYGLIESAGKIDAPGKPMSYRTTDQFLRLFGYSSLEELPELPRITEEQMEIKMTEKEQVEKNEEQIQNA